MCNHIYGVAHRSQLDKEQQSSITQTALHSARRDLCSHSSCMHLEHQHRKQKGIPKPENQTREATASCCSEVSWKR